MLLMPRGGVTFPGALSIVVICLLFVGHPCTGCRSTAAAAEQTPVDQAITALGSKDPSVRKNALATIDAAGNPQAAGAVSRLIADPQVDVREAAISTLLTLVLPATPPAPRGNWHTFRPSREAQGAEARARQALIDAVQPIRPVPVSAFEPLVDAMSDADSPVRASASYAFGVLATSKHGLVPEASRKRALATLVKMITSPYQDTRILAMAVAGRAFAAPPDGDPPLTPIAGDALSNALVSAMNMPDVKDQRAAMEALGRLREIRALKALSERFVYHREHGPRQHAVVALEALARIGDPATASLIRPLVDSVWTRRNDTRLAMLFARARLFNDGSEERLRREVDDKKNGAQARAYLLELGVVP